MSVSLLVLGSLILWVLQGGLCVQQKGRISSPTLSVLTQQSVALGYRWHCWLVVAFVCHWLRLFSNQSNTQLLFLCSQGYSIPDSDPLTFSFPKFQDVLSTHFSVPLIILQSVNQSPIIYRLAEGTSCDVLWAVKEDNHNWNTVIPHPHIQIF